FFFSSRRRHTRSKRDWSSDVCSSDLLDYNILLFPAFHLKNHVQLLEIFFPNSFGVDTFPCENLYILIYLLAYFVLKLCYLPFFVNQMAVSLLELSCNKPRRLRSL